MYGHDFVDGVCGAQDPNYKPSHTHSYTASVTKEATCTEKGETKYTCECGDSYTEIIPVNPNNHSWQDAAQQDATCTEDRHEAGKTCTRCRATEGQETIGKLDHDWATGYSACGTG